MAAFLFLAVFLCCSTPPTAKELVNEAIEVAGGERYRDSEVRFYFRDREYIRTFKDGREVLKRVTRTGDSVITDIRQGGQFNRLVDGIETQVPDSLARSISNSVNSVHYFAYLPYRLNDPAVKKKILGTTTIKGTNYYEVEVRFQEEGGGDDYEDVYVYWINAETKKPDYLGYFFHTDDGGYRFREAYNERYAGGLRFVDYRNYQPRVDQLAVHHLDSLFLAGELELLSKIELDSIEVSPGNYN